MSHSVHHRHMSLEGVKVFYREAGPANAPVVLLPHGYPCSSYEFRNYMPPLADRWRLLAADFPGMGYSDTPDEFSYDFDGYADFLDRFTRRLKVRKFAIYLHDFGSQIGLRLAIKRPDRIVALIFQNAKRNHAASGDRQCDASARFSGNHDILSALTRGDDSSAREMANSIRQDYSDFR